MPLKLQNGNLKIQSIHKQEYLYRLVLDDKSQILCVEDDIFNYFLEVGKELKAEIIEKLMDKHNYYLCLNQAFKLINQKSYSKKQLELKLKDYQFTNEVLQYLEDNNLINDEIYAQDLCEAKKLQGYGPKYIINLLKQLHIDYPIDYSYEEEYQLLKTYFEKSKVSAKGLFEKKFKEKMIYKGFSLSVIEEVLNNNQKCYDDNFLKKDYEKIHNKYQKKYSGYQLQTKIYQYLINKGYDREEVATIVKEDFNEN